jgi:hypothetical protein
MTEVSSCAGTLGRRSFLRNGLLVGAGAAALAVASVSVARPARAAETNPQGLWFWCQNCAQLFWDGSGNGASGGCPINNVADQSDVPPHQAPASPWVYALTWGDPTESGTIQEGWRYCSACKVLTWPSAAVANQCPLAPDDGTDSAGYHTIISTTSVYDVWMMDPGGGVTFQPGWNYCNDCKDLYHGSQHAAGVCMVNSWNYAIAHDYAPTNQPHQPYTPTTSYYVQYSS